MNTQNTTFFDYSFSAQSGACIRAHVFWCSGIWSLSFSFVMADVHFSRMHSLYMEERKRNLETNAAEALFIGNHGTDTDTVLVVPELTTQQLLFNVTCRPRDGYNYRRNEAGEVQLNGFIKCDGAVFIPLFSADSTQTFRIVYWHGDMYSQVDEILN